VIANAEMAASFNPKVRMDFMDGASPAKISKAGANYPRKDSERAKAGRGEGGENIAF
jgi:hypothetical protein